METTVYVFHVIHINELVYAEVNSSHTVRSTYA